MSTSKFEAVRNDIISDYTKMKIHDLCVKYGTSHTTIKKIIRKEREKGVEIRPYFASCNGKKTNFVNRAPIYAKLFRDNPNMYANDLAELFNLTSDSVLKIHIRMVKEGWDIPPIMKRRGGKKSKIKPKEMRYRMPDDKANTPPKSRLDDPKPTKVKDFSTGYKSVRIDSKTFKLQKTA